MANYRLVDVDQLETDMEGLADTIRAKGGTTEQLKWPDGYNEAVSNISVGVSLDAEDGLIDGTTTEYFNDRVASIYDYAFYNNRVLLSVDFPAVKTINASAFYGCRQLQYANFPLAETICTSAFCQCYLLATLDFPKAKQIQSGALQICNVLKALVLRNSEMCTLANVNVLQNTPIKSGTGYIYVPAALADTYKADSVWGSFAAQFRALEDYTVDGTVTGALDETKI